MNEIQLRIAAQLWNQCMNSVDIAQAIFGTSKVMINAYPVEYTYTEAIVCRNLNKIRNIARRMRLNVPEST